jgi:hypothetical protein
MTQAFGATSAIKTGVTASTDAPQMGTTMMAEVPDSADGFLTPNAGYIMVGNKKVMGVPTVSGFFYSKDLGKEAVAELESLVERGYAYATEAAAE